MTRADYGICLFFLVAKQSLSENLISTERDLTQRRTIQSQSWSELNWTELIESELKSFYLSVR